MATTVRRLSSTADITYTTGAGGVDAITYGTVAFLFKPLSIYASTARTLFRLHDLAGLDLGGVGLDASNKLSWSDGTSTSAGGTVTAEDWHVLLPRKPTGTATPRFSILNLTTSTWSHSDGDASLGDWTAPTGGSIRMSVAGSNGAGGDIAAMAVWANGLPWTADTLGDADIEAADLESHLDRWRDALPSAGWAFNQTSTAYNIEDFTLGRADQISFGGGGVVSASDLTFTYEDTGIEVISRSHLRDTQTESGTGGTVYDLSETQGTPATLASASVNSGSFTEVFRWQRTVGNEVGSSTISTRLDVAVISASAEYQWRVIRLNSAGVEQATSDYSSGQSTTGVKIQSFILDTTWAVGDILALALELRKSSGGGNRTITVDVNAADSWTEHEVTVVAQPITPAAVTITAADGTLTISTGAVGITPAAQAATVTPGALGVGFDLVPAALAVTAAAGAVALTTTVDTSPAPTTVTVAAGVATVAPAAGGAQDITPAAVALSASPATAGLGMTVALAGATVISGAGAVTVTAGAVDITPDPVSVVVAAGVPVTFTGGVEAAPVTVTATGGGLVITTGPVDITPAPVGASAAPGSVDLSLAVELGAGVVSGPPGTVTVAGGPISLAGPAVAVIAGTLSTQGGVVVATGGTASLMPVHLASATAVRPLVPTAGGVTS